LVQKRLKRRRKSQIFVTTVIAKVGDKIVYEMNGSGFVSKNPLLKFKFKGTKGEELEVTWTDFKGNTKLKKLKSSRFYRPLLGVSNLTR